MMKTLSVDLGDRSYPIYIGTHLLGNPDLLLPHIRGQQICIVTNETLVPLYLSTVEHGLKDLQVDTVILPDGEQFKQWETLNTIFDKLLQARHNRTTTLMALGGGVVGDMTGFAAACYQRGVDFIQVPTTLLSQVDSSVGGKTGINHPAGKNMVGAFYQPNCVIADISTLSSLADKELSAGLAEVIKYGLITDQTFFIWLEDNIDLLLARDEQALTYAIERSCQIKADIVALDEKESGIRAILNFGHTFGHAIETAMGYGTWLHGEAVAAGMSMAAQLSRRLGWLSVEDVNRIQELLQRAQLPTQSPNGLTVEQYLSLMAVDKKVVDGKLRLVLLKSLGNAHVTSDLPRESVEKALRDCGTGL